MAKKTRRTQPEIDKLVAEVDALRAGGTDAKTACEKVGIAGSVYWKRKKPAGQTKGVRGSVRAASLPPRPVHGGKRQKRPLNLNDISAVAKRITSLDNKLKQQEFMVRERIRLVAHLVTLLKPTTKTA